MRFATEAALSLRFCSFRVRGRLEGPSEAPSTSAVSVELGLRQKTWVFASCILRRETCASSSHVSSSKASAGSSNPPVTMPGSEQVNNGHHGSRDTCLPAILRTSAKWEACSSSNFTEPFSVAQARRWKLRFVPKDTHSYSVRRKYPVRLSISGNRSTVSHTGPPILWGYTPLRHLRNPRSSDRSPRLPKGYRR